MSKLIAGTRGSCNVSFDELAQFHPPVATPTYFPVAHQDLASRIKVLSQSILRDYTMIDEGYVIARDGNQLFALLNFKADHSDLGMSVAFRNSTDKSMSIGFAVGASVFVCSNLILSGEITVMKKHTPGVECILEDTFITKLHKATFTHQGLIQDSEKMKMRNLNDDGAAKLAGLLYFRGVISPRQLPIVKDQWEKPKHNCFEPRNVFSFYNAVTEALKTSPPQRIMENHIMAHNTVMEGLRNVLSQD